MDVLKVEICGSRDRLGRAGIAVDDKGEWSSGASIERLVQVGKEKSSRAVAAAEVKIAHKTKKWGTRVPSS